jgi:hypothetical protein
MLPAVALKVAVVLLVATDTDAGRANDPLLDSDTVPPPVFDSVTVHVLLAPAARLAGEQASETTVAPVTSEMDVDFNEPVSEAVIVAA